MRQIKGRVIIDCWDNGGKTADRYTIAISGLQSVEVYEGPDRNKQIPYAVFLGASEYPFHPQGFGQHSHEVRNREYRRLDYSRACFGKPIDFLELPPDVRRFIAQELMPEPGEGE